MTETDVARTELAAAADANLATHASWVQQRVAGMRVFDQTGLLLIDSRLPCDTFNLVCHARLPSASAPERVHQAISYFRQVRRPFSWWVGPADEPAKLGELLVQAGLERAESELAMVADLDTLPSVKLAPHGLRITRVRTESQLRDFAQVLAENWTPHDANVLLFSELGAAALLGEDAPLWLYVGYLDNLPVATAELTVERVVGLYNIGTRQAYRRRGFGTALTVQPLLDAREHGYRTVVLQAAPDGIDLYRRVGFREFGTVTEYKPPIVNG
jgi:ribosomal protein S18 acetylase RimI-like enzyme